ncbi:MAG: permease, partial [Spirochaetales bacterium]|nr:permease [Spirochaetales bacterium]
MDTVLHILNTFRGELVTLFLDMAPYIMLGTTIAGILHVAIRKSFVARHAGSGNWLSVVKASLFGVPLPLCSCGVIPTATYLKNAGASKPAVVSFLISTPQTGIDSMIATYGLMGPFMAVFRPITAFIAGITGGTIAHFSEKSGKTPGTPREIHTGKDEPSVQGFFPKLRNMAAYAYFEFIDDIAVNFVIGLAAAALISMAIPDDYFAGRAISQGLPGMLLMVLIGIPMYICSTSSIPIALALMMKGFSPGAAFVFLMAGPATNAASLSVITKVLGKKQTLLFIGSIIVTSLSGGLILDGIISLTGYNLMADIPAHAHGGETVFSWFMTGVSLVFLGLLIFVLIRRVVKRTAHRHTAEERPVTAAGITVLNISGMSCRSCAATAQDAISRVDGITDAEVNIETGQARIKGDFDKKAVIHAIEAAGYG